MPNPNAIVGNVLSIEPPVDGPGEELLRQNPDGFAVSLSGDVTARLVPGERAGIFRDVPRIRDALDHFQLLQVEADLQCF